MFLTKPAATEMMLIIEWKNNAVSMRLVVNPDGIKFSEVLRALQSI